MPSCLAALAVLAVLAERAVLCVIAGVPLCVVLFMLPLSLSLSLSSSVSLLSHRGHDFMQRTLHCVLSPQSAE